MIRISIRVHSSPDSQSPTDREVDEFCEKLHDRFERFYVERGIPLDEARTRAALTIEAMDVCPATLKLGQTGVHEDERVKKILRQYDIGDRLYKIYKEEKSEFWRGRERNFDYEYATAVPVAYFDTRKMSEDDKNKLEAAMRLGMPINNELIYDCVISQMSPEPGDKSKKNDVLDNFKIRYRNVSPDVGQEPWQNFFDITRLKSAQNNIQPVIEDLSKKYIDDRKVLNKFFGLVIKPVVRNLKKTLRTMEKSTFEPVRRMGRLLSQGAAIGRRIGEKLQRSIFGGLKIKQAHYAMVQREEGQNRETQRLERLSGQIQIPKVPEIRDILARQTRAAKETAGEMSLGTRLAERAGALAKTEAGTVSATLDATSAAFDAATDAEKEAERLAEKITALAAAIVANNPVESMARNAQNLETAVEAIAEDAADITSTAERLSRWDAQVEARAMVDEMNRTIERVEAALSKTDAELDEVEELTRQVGVVVERARKYADARAACIEAMERRLRDAEEFRAQKKAVEQAAIKMICDEAVRIQNAHIAQVRGLLEARREHAAALKAKKEAEEELERAKKAAAAEKAERLEARRRERETLEARAREILQSMSALRAEMDEIETRLAASPEAETETVEPTTETTTTTGGKVPEVPPEKSINKKKGGESGDGGAAPETEGIDDTADSDRDEQNPDGEPKTDDDETGTGPEPE